MKFSTSLRKVFIENYFNFNGRATRTEFWWPTIFILVLNNVLYMIGGLIFPEYGCIYTCEELTPIDYAPTVVNVITMLPLLAVLFRRYHDINKSGWWFLLPVIPAVIFFYVSIFAILVEIPPAFLIETPESTEPDFWALFDNTLFLSSFIVMALSFLYAYVYLPLKIGDKEANRYGEVPQNES